jgi:UDP-2,4-diacetamido-2,4,6-trideoxy-beta-L-altropyranose hydrolase
VPPAAIAIVTQGGPAVGLGHVRRCLTLAAALAEPGARVSFVLGPDPSALEAVRARGFETSPAAHTRDAIATALVSLRPDLTIVDSYDLGTADLAAIAAGRVVAVIDDLAERPLPVDAICNGGIAARAADYAGKTGPRTRILAGPRYTLLAPEYRRLPAKEIRPRVERVLVSAGGGDAAGALPRLLRAARRGLPEAAIDVVLGPYASRPEELRGPLPPHVRVFSAPPSLAPLMMEVDMSVSAGGQTAYELAATGTPSVLVAVADNQRPQSRELDRRGIAAFAGDLADGEATEARVIEHLIDLAADRGRRQVMSAAGRACLDGEGAARTAAALRELCGMSPCS